jgi:hypothetical protein
MVVENRDTLVADGQLGSRAAISRQIDELEHALGRPAGVLHALEPAEELEVLARRQPPVLRGPLRDPADLRRRLRRLDPALAQREGAREEGEERRLAGAVRPDEGDDVAGQEIEVHALKSDPLAEAARDAAGGEERGAQRPPRLSG